MAISREPQVDQERPPFIPNLCTLQAVFFLVLLGELLAVSLSIVRYGMEQMDWLGLGLSSFLIQWIVLASAALLCPLRPWLARSHPLLAGTSCYALVLGVALVCSLLGEFFLMRSWPGSWELLNGMLLAAIFGGIVLRYLYIQQQLHNQQQAELRARIQALQSRIRPHFLFNSLNSIASLVDSEPDTAETMIEDLACLFRASLSEPGLISLAEELELCHQYVAIEQRRLGERLTVTWHLSDELRQHLNEILIPSLLLQPLLENSVHHGIQPRPEGGEVVVDLQLEGQNLHIAISNPVLHQAPSHVGNRMALENIANRLQAHFGPSASFTAEDSGECFDVHIRYPWRSAQE